MKKIIYLIILMLAAGPLMAQTNGGMTKKEERKLLKEERKRAAEEEKERIAKKVDLMMDTRAFVLEADMIYDRYGQSTPVQADINFILVDSLYGVIQVGSPFYLGRNGVGGVTIEGEVKNYEMSRNEKRGTYQVNYMVYSPVGTYDVSVNISNSGRADARVSGNFSGSLRYTGRVVHPAETRVFQGTSF